VYKTFLLEKYNVDPLQCVTVCASNADAMDQSNLTFELLSQSYILIDGFVITEQAIKQG